MRTETKLLAAVLLLAGCSSQPRFRPIGDSMAALDTKTGQRCYTGPKNSPESAPNPNDPFDKLYRDKSPAQGLPYCVDFSDGDKR